MKYEFIIRELSDHNDLRKSCCSEDRYEYVKSQYEKELKRLQDKDHRVRLVLLINLLNDDGSFETTIQ